MEIFYLNQIFNRNMVMFRVSYKFQSAKNYRILLASNSLQKKKKNPCHIHYKVDLAGHSVLHNPFCYWLALSFCTSLAED